MRRDKFIVGEEAFVTFSMSDDLINKKGVVLDKIGRTIKLGFLFKFDRWSAVDGIAGDYYVRYIDIAHLLTKEEWLTRELRGSAQ